MVTKAAAKKNDKKTSLASSRAKTVKKSSTVTKKTPKRAARQAVPEKVDYYPNRMTVAVSALAGTLLVLFALIAVLGSQ